MGESHTEQMGGPGKDEGGGVDPVVRGWGPAGVGGGEWGGRRV